MNPLDLSISFSEVRDWLELLYFVSGVVVMVLVAFGLWQLKLTKDQITLAKEQLESSRKIFRTQSKRAAVEAAVFECRRFSETLVQDSIALDKYCKEHSITYFDDVKFEKTDDGFRLHTEDIKKEDVDKLAEASELINRYINGLEAYALFFLSGVADENIAFHSNAKTFIQLAETAFKFFAICNIENEDAGPVKALYFRWHEKYEAKKLTIEKKKIESQLSEYKESEIKAIGT